MSLRVAEALFPSVAGDLDALRDRYNPREVDHVVSRVAPSPTGMLHLGTLLSALVPWMFIHQSDGTFILRIEDTDQNRKIENGVQFIIDNLIKDFGLTPDEGRVAPGEDVGDYGPYQQSERLELYHIMAKYMIAQDLAYPCWLTSDELDELRQGQMLAKQPPGVHGEYATWSHASDEEILTQLEQSQEYVIRLRAPAQYGDRRTYSDIIRGDVTTQAPFVDMVLLKGDRFPTYHLAHLVDDRLMGTTHVIRGDEWMASVPLHTALFESVGLKPPMYGHIAPLLKSEGGNKRKLSKRKDPEADVRHLVSEGFLGEGILAYLMTILSPAYEERQDVHPDISLRDYSFDISSLNNSGALVDLDKMEQVHRSYLSRLSQDDLYNAARDRSAQYHESLHTLLIEQPEYMREALNIQRHTDQDPKRYVLISDVYDVIKLFDDAYRSDHIGGASWPESFTHKEIATLLYEYAGYVSLDGDTQSWFDALKQFGTEHGFAMNNKQYKEGGYRGKIGNLAMLLRIALTGESQTPDLFAMMQIMGHERVKNRLCTAKKYS